MDFKEKIAWLRSNPIIGKTVDLLPYGMEYLEETLTLRNQEQAKYNMTQVYDVSREQQTEWIKGYESRDDEFGHMVYNKRNEIVGISFCYNYDGESMEIGRAAFDLTRTVGMPYAFETSMLSAGLVFNYLNLPIFKTIVKSDNLALLKFYKKLKWTNKGTCVVRNQVYEILWLYKDDSNYHNFEHILEARQNKFQS